MDVNNNDNINEMYKRYVGQRQENPIIDENGLQMPIKRMDNNPEIENEENLEAEEDVYLRFMKCEHCEEWQTPDVIYIVDTYESIIFNEDNELSKDIKRETQSWCVNCITEIKNRCKTYQESVDTLNEEIKKAKIENQKIISVQDREGINQRLLEQEIREEKIRKEMEKHTSLSEDDNDDK